MEVQPLNQGNAHSLFFRAERAGVSAQATGEDGFYSTGESDAGEVCLKTTVFYTVLLNFIFMLHLKSRH